MLLRSAKSLSLALLRLAGPRHTLRLLLDQCRLFPSHGASVIALPTPHLPRINLARPFYLAAGLQGVHWVETSHSSFAAPRHLHVHWQTARLPGQAHLCFHLGARSRLCNPYSLRFSDRRDFVSCRFASSGLFRTMWFSTCLTDSCAGTCLTTPFSITSDLLYARLDGARTRRERLTRDNPRHILVEHAPRLAHEGKARTAPMFEQQHWRRKLDEMSTGPECQGKGSSPTLDICWPMLGNATYTSFDGVRTAGGVSRAGQASLNLDFPPLSLTHRFSSDTQQNIRPNFHATIGSLLRLHAPHTTHQSRASTLFIAKSLFDALAGGSPKPLRDTPLFLPSSLSLSKSPRVDSNGLAFDSPPVA
ncbi:hypothetical protein RTBOTA2_004492 [Rhodotorula toruloides]|nr:hypothetical protein RTBOTA2_004492 [Rhodotorula toruloides]